jgi:hypothetical protein
VIVLASVPLLVTLAGAAFTVEVAALTGATTIV